jgi:hypothetical protein
VSTYRETDRLMGVIYERIEMGSLAMIYVPSFIKIHSGRGIRIHRQQGDIINLLSFFFSE